VPVVLVFARGGVVCGVGVAPEESIAIRLCGGAGGWAVGVGWCCVGWLIGMGFGFWRCLGVWWGGLSGGVLVGGVGVFLLRVCLWGGGRVGGLVAWLV